jgi:glycogen operon protein
VANGRQPTASINFITAHDGFTLNDLVSYNEKHNEANGENNQDGEAHNRSWNCGVEGPTDDPQILALRAQQKRNLLSTLIFSQGVPMILMGDESSRTQQGNNNAYCHDNEISWMDWENADPEMLAFTRRLISLLNEHPVFRQRRWFQGRAVRGSKLSDIGWFTPDGNEMSEETWSQSFAHSLGVFLNGKGIGAPDYQGRRVIDDSFYLMFNASDQPIEFVLPALEGYHRWQPVLDTTRAKAPDGRDGCAPGDKLTVDGRSLMVLCHAA